MAYQLPFPSHFQEGNSAIADKAGDENQLIHVDRSPESKQDSFQCTGLDTLVNVSMQFSNSGPKRLLINVVC